MAAASTAVFSGRLVELGLQEHAATFKAEGWTSYNAFAFAAGSYVPGGDDNIFLTEVVIPLFGGTDHPLKPTVRFLHYEAFTIVAEELRRRALPVDDEKPRKLPILERTSRLHEIRAQLAPGIIVEGEYEPSYSLIDKFAAMQEEGTLKYLHWSELGRRDAEVRGAKTERFWKADGSGAIKEQSHLIEIEADTSSDLRLRIALQRRGIAMQAAKLLSYTVHDLWVAKLFKEYFREPLFGYEKTTLQQVQLADAELFAEMAELSNGSLTAVLPGILPLDIFLPRVMADPRVSTLLVPLPARARQQAPPIRDTTTGESKKEKKRKAATQRAAQHVAPRGPPNKAAKGAGKDAKGGRPPKELTGLLTEWKGKRICYAYNIDGCKFVVEHGACSKGMHVCARCGSSDHNQKSSRCPKAGKLPF